jgi:hypothetical protein
MEKSASRDRGLAVTLTALEKSALCLVHSLVLALWAFKSIWPTYGDEIINARLFTCKALSKFNEGFWKVFHALTLYIVVLGVKCIPPKKYYLPHTGSALRVREEKDTQHVSKQHGSCLKVGKLMGKNQVAAQMPG